MDIRRLHFLFFTSIFSFIVFDSKEVNADIDIHYVVNDHLGTPQIPVDEDQNIVWKAGKDAFGNDQPEIEQVEFNIRFPGQYYDKETGTHYNYYRDYDPALGRYLQSDPRGILLDFSDPQRQVAAQMGVGIPLKNSMLNHNYGYADGNPVNLIDPSGETPAHGTVFLFGCATGAGIAVISGGTDTTATSVLLGCGTGGMATVGWAAGGGMRILSGITSAIIGAFGVAHDANSSELRLIQNGNSDESATQSEGQCKINE